ncbi:hypothetical protein [Medusavirus stheno T3]|uniref:Uncharacterized protein n=1 Tax=Medusavirus stheno T3 TaxID=3069717 RepID=A0A7S7YER7_9VIRU|nr:hypothetical protein QKU73_gp314 [Acanthamoeba castellanii medusavirus]QPB44461.1 hypothetical protein [Medusavirus stheno T3]
MGDELAAANALMELGMQTRKRSRTALITSHRIPGTEENLYAIFNSDTGEQYLFIHELCRLLGMNRTTIAYWFRVSGASKRQIKHDKNISASARILFGGRNSYVFYGVRDVVLTLTRFAASRQPRREECQQRVLGVLEFLKTIM